MNQSDNRELHNGFGDALANAFEFAVTPAVFGVLGFLLDRFLGVIPLFTLIFSTTVLSYMFWKFWRRYEADMDRHEASLSRPKRS